MKMSNLPSHAQARFAIGNIVKSPGFQSVTDGTGKTYDKDDRKEFWADLVRYQQVKVAGNGLTVRLSF